MKVKHKYINRPSKGATLIEYVLIISLLSVALIGIYKKLGQGYKTIYLNISSNLDINNSK